MAMTSLRRRPRLLLAHTVPERRPGRGFASEEESVGHPPLNLLALATSARAAGVEVEVADLALAASPGAVLEHHLSTFRPNVVGFGCTTPTVDSVLALAARSHAAGARVVVGGAGAVCEPDVLLASADVDAVVHGEGEEPLVELVHAWTRDEHADVAAIAGVQTCPARRPRSRPRRRSLDEASSLDFGFIDMKPYVEADAVGLVTSRGCPYDCHFCACRRIWPGAQVTSHGIERLMAVLDDVVARFDYEGRLVTFFDDTFTLDPRRVGALCEALRTRPYRLRWKAMTRVDRVDPVLLATMREAGCVHVAFGIEAVNDEDLTRLNKRITMREVRRAIAFARDAGVRTEGFFLMGLPWHRKQDLLSSVDEAHALGLDVTRFSCLTPFPGTLFHDNAAQLGIRVPIADRRRFTGLVPVIESDGFSLADQATAVAAYLARTLASPESLVADEGLAPAGDHAAAGARPASPERWEVSRYLAEHDTTDGTLVFEYLNGSYTLLNKSAATALALSRDHRSVSELHRAMSGRYGNVNRSDVEEIVQHFQEVGFIDAR
jgi:radical SAM superfamily enzyme YgiQ (UPF0313 family)